MFRSGTENLDSRGMSIDLIPLLPRGAASTGTMRRVLLTGSVSTDGLPASRGPCSPAVEVLRLFVIDTVSFRRLLPVRFVLVMDLRVVSESRRAVSLGVKPALVRGVE